MASTAAPKITQTVKVSGSPSKVTTTFSQRKVEEYESPVVEEEAEQFKSFEVQNRSREESPVINDSVNIITKADEGPRIEE